MGLFGSLGLGGAALIGGSALLGAGASFLSGREQAEAAERAGDLQREIYYRNREDLAPYREVGRAALSDLRDIYLTGEKDYTTSPGYDFRLSQGVEARERAASARGRRLSGAQEKALTRFGQDYATADYDQNFNRLSALAGTGQTATNTGVSAGQNYASGMGRATENAGAARASGYVGGANAISGGINNALSLAALRGLFSGNGRGASTAGMPFGYTPFLMGGR